MVEKKGKDLTKEPPRSPYEELAGFVILARTIDKCRALLFGNIGDYHFDCPLDNMLFSFKGVKGRDFRAIVESGASDEEIAAWMRRTGIPRSETEIGEWARRTSSYNYSEGAPQMKAWLQGENRRLGLDEDASLFAMLEVDDRAAVGADVCPIG